MIDLPRAASALIAAASGEAEPSSLRPFVEDVLEAFDGATEPARASAVRALGRALDTAKGGGAHVLALALGALVETGASPELAWPALSRDLEATLASATAFASAVVRASKEQHLDDALERSGAAVAKKRPRDAEAWSTLPTRCLAAIACLARSKKVRARARKAPLLEAAWPLTDAVPEVGALFVALRVVDGEQILVLAPSEERAWRVAVDGLAANAELYVLLADALVGDGGLRGKRPAPTAVAALQAGVLPKKAKTLRMPFVLRAPEDPESEPCSHDHDHDHGHDHDLPPDGVVDDLPVFGRRRVVFLERSSAAPSVEAAPTFDGLRPELRVIEELSPAAAQRMLRRFAEHAPQEAPAPKAPARRSARK